MPPLLTRAELQEMLVRAEMAAEVTLPIEQFRDLVLQAFPSETKRKCIPVRLVVRPMLVRGMLASDNDGPMILINSEEEPPHEQVITLWHEVLHLIGMTDEFLCDEYAMKLADAAPDILRRLAHNINVPDSPSVVASTERKMSPDLVALQAFVDALPQMSDNELVAFANYIEDRGLETIWKRFMARMIAGPSASSS